MAPFKLAFLFILVCFTNSVTTVAQDYISGDWGSECFGEESSKTFQLNLKTLFFYLSSNATANTEFYNTTVTGRNPSDTVLYGQFMCRGDISSHLCGNCVVNATQKLYSECSLLNHGVIWYEKCMVRYSNSSFFSTVDLSFPQSSCDSVNASNQASYERLVSKIMNEGADEAANFSIGAKKYATKQARISGFQTLYCQAQCTPDLSPKDCRNCLNLTITTVQQNCKGNIAGKSENPSCYIRFDLYPFFRPNTAPAPSSLVPASNTDSKYSQYPVYLSHNCSNNETMNNPFLSNLRTLFSSLTSNATTKTGFFKTTVNGRDPSDTVHGLFMCRGDISPFPCQLCVQNATERLSSECSSSSSREAIIWYDHCLLRYSDRSLHSTVDTSPQFHEFNTMIVNSSKPNVLQLQSFFTWTLAETLSKVKTEIGGSTIKNYRTSSLKLNDQQTIYALAQCTPDLSDSDCNTCLKNIFLYEIPWDADQVEMFGQPSIPSKTKGVFTGLGT
ncbi:Gnk2-homologous domain [Sesbania bispinosa]|nr:Gnk2-homologous domain [Sesbania bispinosa]